jgi:hypothetical protein
VADMIEIAAVYSSFMFLVAVGMNTTDTMDTKGEATLFYLGVLGVLVLTERATNNREPL